MAISKTWVQDLPNMTAMHLNMVIRKTTSRSVLIQLDLHYMQKIIHTF